MSLHEFSQLTRLTVAEIYADAAFGDLEFCARCRENEVLKAGDQCARCKGMESITAERRALEAAYEAA